ncbi:hypothetical protein ABPG75_002801 [Micractinium tetrahymenae]
MSWRGSRSSQGCCWSACAQSGARSSLQFVKSLRASESQLLLVNSSMLRDSAPAAVPPLPSWALAYDMEAESQYRKDSWYYNLEVAAAANASGEPLDFVIFGDSMTARIRLNNPESWADHFGDLQGAPMGVGGNTVQELMWRLGVGGERFAVSPRVVVIWIGYNDLIQGSDPVPYLDFLLRWARAAWPGSHLLLLNVLPNTSFSPVVVAAVNAQYGALAARWGASFSTCGCRIDPTDTSLLKDGHHPAEAGYQRIFRCLRHQYDALVAADAVA